MRRRDAQRLVAKRARQAGDLATVRAAIVEAVSVATKPEVLSDLLKALDAVDDALAEVAPDYEPPALVGPPQL